MLKSKFAELWRLSNKLTSETFSIVSSIENPSNKVITAYYSLLYLFNNLVDFNKKNFLADK